MSDVVPTDLEKHARQAVEPIVASPGRKRRMLEELLGHVLAAFEEECAHLGDESSAADAAWKRLGDVGILRNQLQASVPFPERLLFHCLGRKETFMSRVLLLLGILTVGIGVLVGFNVLFPKDGPFVIVGALAVAGGFCLVYTSRDQRAVTRFLGPYGVWLIAAFCIFFGPAIILPALAKLKQGIVEPEQLYAIALGAVIVFEGLGFLMCGVMRRHPRAV